MLTYTQENSEDLSGSMDTPSSKRDWLQASPYLNLLPQRNIEVR